MAKFFYTCTAVLGFMTLTSATLGTAIILGVASLAALGIGLGADVYDAQTRRRFAN